MSYVSRTLGPNEAIVHRATFHWLYTLTAWLLTLSIVGVPWGVPMLITRYFTEIAVTSRRFVKKTGLIARDTEEVSLDRIEEVRLEQSVWGRLFGFGDLTIRGTGEGLIELRMIDDPVRLRREIQSAEGHTARGGGNSAAAAHA